MEASKEIWKSVKGYESRFLISNFGYLKSISGKYRVSKPEGYIFKGTIDTLGYRVGLLRDKSSNTRRIRIHTLVASHFCKRPKFLIRPQVNHKDGDKLNNHFSNLEWVSQRRNIQHAVETGLMNFKGENHPSSKLTKVQVIEMRRLRKKEGWTHQKIADLFYITRRQAGDVINGVNWGWLKTPFDR